MKKIIVPYDFSQEARNGISLAAQLADYFKATIQLVHVPKNRNLQGIEVEREKQAISKRFDETLEQITPIVPSGIPVEYLVKYGKVYKEICAQAEASDDSIIVASTHGASGFEEFFIGSNALRMISASQKPIYTIHHGVEARRFGQIIFPLDTSFGSRQKAAYIANAAKVYGCPVSVLAIAEKPTEKQMEKLAAYTKQVEEYLAKQGVEYQVYHIEGMDFVDATITFAKDKLDALIVITEQDKNSLPVFLIGDNSQRFLCKSPVPVLILPPRVNLKSDSFHTFGQY
ncbi:MAG: hypothetical protein CSA97_00900 [Bacteroidetes bacterium]|nr:MAG: hypothetical protein CSA97_00900 [Bacteroidota bacterium]